MQALQQYIGSLSRQELVQIATAVQALRCVRVIDFLGTDAGYLITSADDLLLKKLIGNLRQLHGVVDIALIKRELVERGYFCQAQDQGSTITLSQINL